MLSETTLNFILSLAVIGIGTAVSVFVRIKFHPQSGRSYLSVSIFAAAALVSATLLSGIRSLVFDSAITSLFSDSDSILIVMAAVLAGLCVQIAVEIFRNRIQQERIYRSISRFLLIFEVLVICILISDIFYPEDSAQAASSYNNLLFFGAIYLTACMVILLLIRHAEMTAAMHSLEESRRLSELEQTHYAAVEARRQEMNRIRSDYNRQLSAIRQLLEENRPQQAVEQLEDLSVQVASTSEYPFCGIPVINAVLTGKKERCDQYDILFFADMLLPDDLPFRSLDLCMALGNMMDNAIAACCRISAESETRPRIQLYGEVIQGYLVLKCVNTIPSASDSDLTKTMPDTAPTKVTAAKAMQDTAPNKATATKAMQNTVPTETAAAQTGVGQSSKDNVYIKDNAARRRGYGLQILKDIATRYDGDFYTSQTNDAFTAQLCLLMNGDYNREETAC